MEPHIDDRRQRSKGRRRLAHCDLSIAYKMARLLSSYQSLLARRPMYGNILTSAVRAFCDITDAKFG